MPSLPSSARFVSATTYEVPSVREDSLSDPYWAALYRGARRPREAAPAGSR